MAEPWFKNIISTFNVQENKSKLKLVPINGGKGPVLPTDSTVRTGVYAPLSRPEFIYVKLQSAGLPHVQDFIRFYIEQAPVLVKEVGYVPLPAEAYQLAYQRFTNKVTGSMFTEKSIVGADLIKLLQGGKEP